MPVLFVSRPGVPPRPHRFEGRAMVGRDEGNDVRLADPTVSAHHALVLVMPDGSAVLKDLRSANGCQLDGRRVRSARLQDGDAFAVCGHQLRYQADLEETDSMVTVDWNDEEEGGPVVITGPFDLESPEARGDIASMRGRAKDLVALYALANAVHSCRSEEELYQAVSDLVQRATGASRGAMVEYDAERESLELRASWPEGDELGEDSAFSRTVVDRVIKGGQTILVPDVSTSDGVSAASSIVAAEVKTVLCVPMRCQERILGTIFVADDEPGFQFHDRHVRLVNAIGIEVGTALQNQRLYRELERDFFATIRVLVKAIGARDAYTQGHAERVAHISVAIARCIPLKADQVRAVRLGALLHDIGKLAVVDRCLKGGGALSDADYAHVREHAIAGDKILAPLRKLQHVRSVVRHHHERWDGTGYPDGLAGEDIPLEARIVAVADTLDAIVSSRSYREGRPVTEALVEVTRVAGAQLDPGLMRALARARQQGFLRRSLWGFGKHGATSARS